MTRVAALDLLLGTSAFDNISRVQVTIIYIDLFTLQRRTVVYKLKILLLFVNY